VLFPTWTFLYFLAAVVLVRWALPQRLVVPWLLLASYVFYLSWGPIYGLLIGGVTIFAWGLGLLIARRPERRRLWIWLGCVIFLGTLAFFKYTQFLVNELHALLAPTGEPPPALGIVLPLGISFFTFQALSYIIDVYRGHAPEPSLMSFSLFKAFFPQLIAGPIVRVDELCPQIHAPQPFRAAQFADGLELVIRGLLKKIVIADRLAEHVDIVFAAPESYGTLATWLAVLAYAGQIYCDFSGYTDIGRGASKLMGYELPLNFDLPYLASNITEFWRKWHMTLSRWLRDYLYISLGGNRHGEGRRNLNLMLTMALGGLWHGAGWPFLIWGVYHGSLLILHKRWRALTPGLDAARKSTIWHITSVLFTFLLVALGWVVFRAPTLDTALTVYGNLLPGAPNSVPVAGLGWIWAMLTVLLISHLLARWADGRWLWGWLSAHPGRAWLRGLAWALAIIACYLFAGRPAEFIYFAF
jgi:D-alanyl-lipoteichoic acid acyltransferase DltB (MBOAT superfamily)